MGERKFAQMVLVTWIRCPPWPSMVKILKNLHLRNQKAKGLYTCIKSRKKKCIKSDFKEIFLKLVANDGSDKRFLMTSKFCPMGLSAPDLQLYTFIKSWKDVYKSEIEEIVFKLATNDHSDKAFLLISKFWPEWVVCPYPRAMFKLLFLNNCWF